MSESDQRKTIKRIKTGAFERRFSVAKAGFVAGTRLVAQSAGNVFTAKEHREAKQKEILARQAQYLADEIGKLKGSIVKIGQMMALYGEHFLPKEVTDALHTLEDDTTALDWTTIYETIEDELGEDRLAQLEIDENPIGCASIGQVHRATIRATGEQICLKVQYPGVADAVDSDLNAVETLLRVLKIIPITDEFHTWYQEIRDMMHREVDYGHELEKTALFRERLKHDDRYIVPKVYPEFSTPHILATAYEPGIGVDSETALNLSQERRNLICRAALDLCWSEVFRWGEMQTDPNFGNYFIRLGDGESVPDRMILLDFGAVREFSASTIEPGRKIVRAAFEHNEPLLFEGLVELGFLEESTPIEVKRSLAKVVFLAIEPFNDNEANPPPSFVLNEKGEYLWGKSDLPGRIALKATAGATTGAASRTFILPPREVMFLIRKIMGAYTFLSVLSAELKGREILEPYV
ncbi:Predicted ABC1 family protein [gamma proteobacterium HdN1]|nr:Predicted ABC1 family protein [gamma proteobacterium HdN1]